MKNSLLLLIAMAGWISVRAPAQTNFQSGHIHKLKDVKIYEDRAFHSAFPSVVRRPDGELIVAFRRAPDWRQMGEGSYTHLDAKSQLVCVRSRDGGNHWTTEPQLIYADPFGGSQDPCLLQLTDGSILCSSYGWACLKTNLIARLKQPVVYQNQFVFMGGYLLRSENGGASWSAPILPPAVKGEARLNLFGQLCPAFNRGAMVEGKNGLLYWAVVRHDAKESNKTSTHLLISKDRGKSWSYSCVIAEDERIAFNETSLYQTPKGDLVAFMRTAGDDDHTCIARSTDGGKSFQKWEDAGFQGHPHHALCLPDNRVLLVYGYRHPPCGIRARLLDPECTNIATAEETILRDDGGGFDLGYPWSVLVDGDRVLVVYYFNVANGVRYIAGTFVSVE